MKRRYIALSALVAVVALLVASAAGGYAWLVYTESGLAWLTARLSGYGGEDLTLEGVAGTLAGGARVASIRYAGKDMEVRVRDAGLRIAPWSVLTLKAHITDLHATEVAVVTKPSEPRGKPPDTLALPANFVVENAAVEHLIVDTGGKPVDITNAKLKYAGGKSEHRVDGLSLNVLGLVVSLNGKIAAQPPFALEAAFSAARPDDPQASIMGSATGTLSAIKIDANGRSRDARIAATATVQQYDELALTQLDARVGALDLEAFFPDLPQTRIDGRVTLDRRGRALSGPVELTNKANGPYDQNRLPLAAFRANVETDLKRVTFTALAADLGRAGTVSGSGRLNTGVAELTLKTANLNLAGAYTKLRETHLAGTAHITLEDARQTITADLKQDDLGLRLTANRTGEKVEIPQFEARARGGVASGHAQLSTAKPQPFALQAEFSRFDPKAWGSFPSGSINGTLKAEGTVEGPAADVTFTIAQSRWLNAPLAGNGKLSVTSERVRNADVDVRLGRNHISARGALGTPADTLAVTFDAPQPSLVDPTLRGTLRGTIQLSGAFRALRARFDVTGSGLAYGSYGRIAGLDARGIVNLQPNGQIDVTARATGVDAQQFVLKSASLRIDGTAANHTGVVQASGERVDFRARAQGGWNEKAGWRGTLQELANRGEVPVELVAPVKLAIAPGQVRVEPFTLRAVGGELAVSELVYEKGRLATAGRLTDFPVKPVVALAGGPADMAGTLRLGGTWSIRSTPKLLGSITLNRQSGDLTLGPRSPYKVGLETLALQATLAENGIRFDANVRSALAAASAQGTIAPVGGRYSAASPIDATARADVAQLSRFTAFIDTPIILRGEAHAQVRAQGTVGDPQVTGPITADRLAVALPAEGIDLRRGSLRAMLLAKEVRVDSFSIQGGDGVLTAQGTLARIGFDTASLDWQAERFQILARPDRRLVLSGKGNAALKEGKVSFMGKMVANEGLFEIGGTALPKLGDDVVIVGRKPATQGAASQPAPKSLKGVAVDLTIDLGNRVEVRGDGLQVWLSGDLHVYTNAQGDILGKGTVTARNGTFVAYGQRLEIDRGVFYFNGPLTNPTLDIVAMRRRQAVEAGVAVSGTLKNPLVRVVSNPALPEGEALSWLILGRGPNQATAGEVSALPLATGLLLGKATGSLSKQLGVDELGIRGGGGGVADQFLTVGKRITDRLYVYLEQSLGGAASVLRLEWTLTQRIVVRAEAGTGSSTSSTTGGSTGAASSVGVFYRYRWD